jgi:hypothetical protein
MDCLKSSIRRALKQQEEEEEEEEQQQQEEGEWDHQPQQEKE